jgi:membrane protease YdiL (CAAX protease family)
MAIVSINRRPGWGWALLQFPLIRIVLFACLLLAAIMLAQSPAIVGIAPHSAAAAIFSLLVVALSVVLYCVLVRLIECRQVAEFAEAHSARDFGSGMLIGTLLFAVTMVVLILLGMANIGVNGNWSALAQMFAGALIAAVLEELLLRGVLFRIVEESLGSWIALSLSALVFGALHAFNPGATLASTMAIALEAGVLLAAAYMYTRTLWMPIGLHLGWNFTEGGIFGASVSGGKSQGWLVTDLHGPDLLTGGAFGPEASIIAVLACLTAGLVLLVLSVRRGHVVPPLWARQQKR